MEIFEVTSRADTEKPKKAKAKNLLSMLTVIYGFPI